MSRYTLLLALAACATAQAATIQFTGLPLDYQNGTYYGFAFATVDGVPNTQLLCDDYISTTYVPSGEMTFDGSYLTGSQPLQYARFVSGHPAAAADLNTYREAAVLLSQMMNDGAPVVSSQTTDYQEAIWHLFTPSVPVTANQQFLLNQASSMVQGASPGLSAIYSQLVIYTPTAAYSSNQEFLAMSGGMSTVPEPAMFFLIGGGLVAFVVIRRRMVRSSR